MYIYIYIYIYIERERYVMSNHKCCPHSSLCHCVSIEASDLFLNLLKSVNMHLPDQDPKHLYTYCPDYHHSMTVVPVDVDRQWCAEEYKKRCLWRTNYGWMRQGKKTGVEMNANDKLHPSAVEELKTVSRERVSILFLF